METSIVQLLPNLGLAGFAMWIMFKMFETYQRRGKEKDQEFMHFINAKDKVFMDEMKLKDQQFRDLEKEVRHNIMTQLAENTSTLSRVLRHFDPPK